MDWWWPATDDRSVLVRLTGLNDAGYYLLDPANGQMTALAVHGPGKWGNVNSVAIELTRNFAAYGHFYPDSNSVILVKHDLRTRRERDYKIPGLRSAAPSGSGGWTPPLGRLLTNGRWFLFNRKEGSDHRYHLVLHDLTTGIQKELFSSLHRVIVTPDHGRVVFVRTMDDSGRTVFRLFSIGQTDLQQRYQVTAPKGIEVAAAYNGGPYLVLRKKVEDASKPTNQLWTLWVRTGQIRKTAILLPTDNGCWVSEGGEQILIMKKAPGRRELWEMENSLPPVAEAK